MEKIMPTSLLSLYQHVSLFVFFAFLLILNTVWAEQKIDYINALDDEAKKTNMKNESPILEPASAKGKGSNIDDIRNIVNEAMVNSKKKPVQTIDTKNQKEVPKTLNQIVEESKDVDVGHPKANYIRSLRKEITEQSELISPHKTIKTGDKQKDDSFVKLLVSGKTITVLQDESLSKVSRRAYGNGNYYMRLYKANRDVIKNPDKIKPGQVLKLPDIPLGSRKK